MNAKIVNSHRRKQIKEFVDKDHGIMTDFYDICDQSLGRVRLKKELKQLIAEDSDFLDPYLMLADVLFSEGKMKEGRKLVEDAYRKALLTIVDKNGNWPKEMRWGWLENRHIMRAIEEYAYLCWEEGKIEKALDIFRRLLRVNPGDNQGARHAVLAIRMNLGVDWEEPFMVKDGPLAGEGLDGIKVSDWFDKNAKNFPDEFNWLFKKWERLGY